MIEELLDIINEQDEVIGKGTRAEIHADPTKLFRIVHVYIFNAAGQLLLQKRAQHKSRPGLLCASAGGHPGAGESRDVAAQRELIEELGIDTELRKLDIQFTSSNPNSRATLYTAIHEGPFSFDDGEVESVHWFSPAELADEIRNHPERFTQGFKNGYQAYQVRLANA